MKSDPSFEGLMKVILLSSLAGGAAMILLAFTQGWSAGVVLGATGIFTVLGGYFSIWAVRSFLARYARQFDEQGTYFTPRLAHADQQLQALSARIGGSYQRGALDWPSFAKGPYALTSTADIPAEPLWGEGSVVRVIVQGLKVEVTYGVQPVRTEQRGLFAQGIWFILAPGVTISRGTPNALSGLNPFHASWSAAEENAVGSERLLNFLVRSAATAAALLRTPFPMVSAPQPLREVASQVAYYADRVFVVGRAPPYDPKVSRDYGQGDFGVESLVDLVQRSVVFVRSLESN